MRRMVCRLTAAVVVALLPVRVAAAPLAQAATFCPLDVRPAFTGGYAALKALAGSAMGEPLTCPMPDPTRAGFEYLRTSTGIATANGNQYTFTNGLDHWALTPAGTFYWTGLAAAPPADAQRLDPDPPAADADAPDPGAAEPPQAPAPAPLPAAAAPAVAAPEPAPDAGGAADVPSPVGADAGPPPAPSVALTPAALAIPTLDLDGVVVRPVYASAAGTLTEPTGEGEAGWVASGHGVGGDGNALLVGRVVSAGRLGVFGSLYRLQPGDTVVVSDASGAVYTFAVESNQPLAGNVPLAQLAAQGRPGVVTLVACGEDSGPCVPRRAVRALLVAPNS